MNTPVNTLRRICFRECYEPAHDWDNLPEGVEEHYDLDFWFVFEDACLAFLHGERRFCLCPAPPEEGGEVKSIPSTPDVMETSCLPKCFLSASLLSITEEKEPGFILRFDNGGIIELGLDYLYLEAEGAGNPYLSPNFYSAPWLADPENAATRGYLDEELAAGEGRNILETLQEEPLPATPANGVPEALLQVEAEEEEERQVSISDFVNELTPREREHVNRALWSGEQVRWATRPQLHLWNNSSLTQFVLGVIWTSICTFAFFEMQEQQGVMTPEGDSAGLGNHLLFSFLPFWCVGLWLLSSPWRQRHRLRETLYIITSRRAIVSEAHLFSWNMQSWKLAKNMVRSRDELSGGRGCLFFCEGEGEHTRGGGFLYLADLARAEKELRRALEAKKGRSRKSR